MKTRRCQQNGETFNRFLFGASPYSKVCSQNVTNSSVSTIPFVSDALRSADKHREADRREYKHSRTLANKWDGTGTQIRGHFRTATSGFESKRAMWSRCLTGFQMTTRNCDCKSSPTNFFSSRRPLFLANRRDFNEWLISLLIYSFFFVLFSQFARENPKAEVASCIDPASSSLICKLSPWLCLPVERATSGKPMTPHHALVGLRDDVIWTSPRLEASKEVASVLVAASRMSFNAPVPCRWNIARCAGIAFTVTVGSCAVSANAIALNCPAWLALPLLAACCCCCYCRRGVWNRRLSFEHAMWKQQSDESVNCHLLRVKYLLGVSLDDDAAWRSHSMTRPWYDETIELCSSSVSVQSAIRHEPHTYCTWRYIERKLSSFVSHDVPDSGISWLRS